MAGIKSAGYINWSPLFSNLQQNASQAFKKQQQESEWAHQAQVLKASQDYDQQMLEASVQRDTSLAAAAAAAQNGKPLDPKITLGYAGSFKPKNVSEWAMLSAIPQTVYDTAKSQAEQKRDENTLGGVQTVNQGGKNVTIVKNKKGTLMDAPIISDAVPNRPNIWINPDTKEQYVQEGKDWVPDTSHKAMPAPKAVGGITYLPKQDMTTGTISWESQQGSPLNYNNPNDQAKIDKAISSGAKVEMDGQGNVKTMTLGDKTAASKEGKVFVKNQQLPQSNGEVLDVTTYANPKNPNDITQVVTKAEKPTKPAGAKGFTAQQQYEDNLKAAQQTEKDKEASAKADALWSGRVSDVQQLSQYFMNPKVTPKEPGKKDTEKTNDLIALRTYLKKNNINIPVTAQNVKDPATWQTILDRLKKATYPESVKPASADYLKVMPRKTKIGQLDTKGVQGASYFKSHGQSVDDFAKYFGLNPQEAKKYWNATQ